MSSFNLKEYQQKNINTKKKVFIEYLYEKYGVSDSGEFDNEYFFLFNDEDLLESLKNYISKNHIKSQVTAQNYITYITDFFKMLNTKYHIKNDTFTDINLYNQLISKSKKIICKLKETESKNAASEEQFETLNSFISDFLDKLVISDIYDEITKVKDGNKKNIKIYNRFVSIIPIKLIMKFALGNLTTISLEVRNLDIENETISINGFKLGLDKELVELFKIYLKIRNYILKLYSLNESKLFIEHDGRPFIRNSPNRENFPYYSAFFKIMDDAIHTKSAELFAARRILEMFNGGIDISTIAKLSDMSIGKCIELQRSTIDNDEVDKKLQQFFYNDENIRKKIIIKKKGYLKCPFCGHEAKAISDEWILVQFKNSGKKYLACRKCKGANGKQFI